ncbi:hypothetical protein [Streptomyces sp. NPDC056672]|uniref:hypothetical protein n=1 Tax=Streptomyces sp. NPDC056672 TaxID=3345906 RepID=UPI0036A342B9
MGDVFACAGCGAVLTASLSRVVLPVHAHHRYGHAMLPALMEPGTYAVDPEPFGPPWRPWSEIGAGEAEARGIFAPVHSLSFGAPGAIVVAPGDTHGTVLLPERCDGCCMGVDGRDGPNLACVRCGRPVATRIDDCSLWQAVRLAPESVRRLPAVPAEDPAGRTVGREAPADRTAGREAPVEEWRGTPPIEPPGRWSPRWEAAAGAALAHLLAVSAGTPVAVPGGLVTDMFGRVLETLLPPGPSRPPAKRAALAGPGLPAPDPAPDIVLVPRHPRTGRAWQSSGTAETVPLAADVWTHLAFYRERLLVPVSGGMPDGVFRDDPLPPYPHQLFRPDGEVFLHTLARLPAVRQPWLRGIYDRVVRHPYARPF